MDRDFFGIYVNFGKWNQREDARGTHEGEGRAPGGQARPGPSWTLRKAVGALLSPQES